MKQRFLAKIFFLCGLLNSNLKKSKFLCGLLKRHFRPENCLCGLLCCGLLNVPPCIYFRASLFEPDLFFLLNIIRQRIIRASGIPTQSDIRIIAGFSLWAISYSLQTKTYKELICKNKITG